ncbi:MAG TPA: leucyl aminopeptidase [Actinophytocola sp.]|uniref:leucyl aminopeptidase n=1 Tax=Actinophytocola sp. TaxID=1872138 RepID=UPI002DBF7CFD|nr:leucyl aminopeptidase [Actinophytocola sp.]HEU5474277.1 leucyl aminopeptidase [Actinophytocola sp.]
MTIEWRLAVAPPRDADAVALPAYAGEPPDLAAPAFLAGCGFHAAAGQILQLPGDPPTVLVGLGPRDGLDQDAVRTAAAMLARSVRGYRRLAIRVPAPGWVRAVVEAFTLGGYRFTRYKSEPGPAGPARVDLIVESTVDAEDGLRIGRALAAGVRLARDLVNETGDALTPAGFADRAAVIARTGGLDCEIWDEHRIAAERLGGLAGVARGSPRPPRLVELTYRPERPAATVALVGKGVTYDAGGLSLKPTAQLVDMAADMAGAATVLGAMAVLAELRCPVRVRGWLPLTENMLGTDPIRVGDVLRIRDGTTVEVRNADAEGRLILADALVLAAESAPDAIIDVATLTDAAAIALGRRIGAVLGNDPDWVDTVRAAATRAGERLWPLPLPDCYRPQLDSRIADLVNYTTGNRHGTALLAGLFLREFVPGTIPWAHLDIQGTALSDGDAGEWVPGATGFGVRTLAELLLTPSGFAPR